MKNFSFLLTLALAVSLTTITNAQTAFTTTHSHSSDSETSNLSVASLQNPWIGGKLVYNIQNDVSDFFELSGRALYAPIQDENFAIPFVTNVSLNNDSLNFDNGVDIGVFPWVRITDRDQVSLLVHGGLNYTITTGSDVTDLFRVMAGLELAIWGKDLSAPPITLSAAPSLVFSTGPENTESAFGLEITGVIPIAEGLGLLMAGTVPFDDVNYINKGVKVGIIAQGMIK